MSSDWQKDTKFKSRFNSSWQGSLRKLGELNLESAVVAYEETDPVNIHPKTMPFRNKNSHSYESLRAAGAFLTTPELARALKVSDRAPENWRIQGIGPKFIRAGGRRILYRWGDVMEYLNSRRFSSTSEESNAA